MIFNETTAIDISQSSEDEIDNVLDRLYISGYLTAQETAPSYYDLENEYYDRMGTSPSYLVCYADAVDGELVVEPCDQTSPRSLRMLDNSRVISLPRALMILGS